MGRSAPRSTKHKKLKAIDPFYKGDRKDILKKESVKCNAKPANPDVQEVPRRLREIMHSQKLMKEGNLAKVKRLNEKTSSALSEDYGSSVKGCDRKVQQTPVFEKRRGETDAELLRRAEAYTRNVIAETKLESKFDVVITEDRHGNVDVEKSTIDIDLELKKMTGKKKSATEKKKLKRKKLEEKRKEKKLYKKTERMGDFDHLQDQVKFGEVVSEPPTIKSVPRKSEPLSAMRKPGAKKLLLSAILGSKELKEIKRELHSDGSSQTKVDRTVKRKYLSVSERRKLDSERENVVEAYRAIKKARQMNKK